MNSVSMSITSTNSNNTLLLLVVLVRITILFRPLRFRLGSRRHERRVVLFLIALMYLLPKGSCLSDSESLLRFKDSLENSQVITWNSSAAPCSGPKPNWVGLLCNKAGQVSGVKLENMSLSGPIDLTPLRNVTSLRSLSLMNNEFQGPLPDLGKLGSLKALYLSGNNFSGTLDRAPFPQMTSLKKVHLARNHLEGRIPVSLLVLTKLFELRLESNRFQGVIPNFALRRWGAFNVSGNSLTGSVPLTLKGVDPTAFGGNAELCGEPLEKCSRVPKPSVVSLVVVALVVLMSVVTIVAGLVIMWRRSTASVPVDDRGGGSEEERSSGTAVVEVLSNQQQNQRGWGETATATTSSSSDAAPVGSASASSSSCRLWFVREDRERFEMQDLLSASAEILGSGSLGSSYKAVVQGIGKVVVVKRCKQMNNVGGREEFQEHMRRLGRLTHPNLLPLVAFYFKRDEKLLVSDFVGSNCSLAAVLRPNAKYQHLRPPWLDAQARLLVACGVARGLAFLQEELPGVMAPHGHLKPSNVLLREPTLEPVLTDYGLIPLVNQEHAQEHMAAYRSPEYVAYGRVTRKTDVWCLGVLILHILSGADPTQDDLPSWVASLADHDDVFDRELLARSDPASVVALRKLLRIAIDCCDSNLHHRLDINRALQCIESLAIASIHHTDTSSSNFTISDNCD